LALTATCASQRVETIADLHCGLNALFGSPVTYKARSNQVANPHFADFARTMAERPIREMTLKVHQLQQGHTLAEVRHTVIQDGKRLRSLRNEPLQTIHAQLPIRQRVELVVQWQVEGQPLCLRLILSWHRRTKSFCYLLTNLAPPALPARHDLPRI